MKRFGLIGFPLGHSFSKAYFTEKFNREGITDAVYDLFPLEKIGDLPGLLSAHPELLGLNVTIPYKEAVIPFLDELDEIAREAGAVNTVRIRDGKLQGFNTDVYGFAQSIKPFLASHHERALILGTGGASKAVYHVLDKIGIDCAFVSRDKTKLDKNQLAFAYEELNEYVLDAFRLIVNTTPLGTFPETDACPAIPFQFLSKDHLVYDLIYNPAETEFLRRAKAQSAQTMNGLDMLRLQAEKAWEIWNG
ncbi:MAG: shikimate dehydrogenase [Bacteroidetes bacterium]|nr:MAG: shikimate dehydrogenase [Bacteroidota bacterium]